MSLPQHSYFLPIQAGAALRDHIDGYQSDDEGDNISLKSPHFYELTCHYWAWKNLNLEKLLHKYDIILPVARHWRGSNTQQYGEYHITKGWEMLRQIIKEHSPQYIPAFEKTMDHSNISVGYNMFITHWKHFNTYSKWLFNILFEFERRVPPIDDPIQSRIYGYMSERLINVFCEYHRLHIKKYPSNNAT